MKPGSPTVLRLEGNPEEGGWRLGSYAWCASQYYSPFGTGRSEQHRDLGLHGRVVLTEHGNSVPTTHFVIDTSRNGQGPLNAVIYANARYNQRCARFDLGRPSFLRILKAMPGQRSTIRVFASSRWHLSQLPSCSSMV